MFRAHYSSSYKPRNVEIAHGGTAYDLPGGRTIILDIFHGFDMSTNQEPSLLNPNQMRSYGIIVDDCPIHLSKNLASSHSIFIPESDLNIPLELNGVISFLPTRKPTATELEECDHIQLTSSVDWDPHSSHFKTEEQEAQNNRNISATFSSNEIDENTSVCYESDLHLGMISSTLNENRFINAVSRNVSVTTAKPKTTTRNIEILSNMWGIGIDTAQRTLNVTTQRGIRTAIHPIH